MSECEHVWGFAWSGKDGNDFMVLCSVCLDTLPREQAEAMLNEHALLKREIESYLRLDEEGYASLAVQLVAAEKENAALKRVREYVEEVCEEDFVMWCREQDALLTADDA